MPNTPIYAFTYPGLSDTPNGPSQIQTLATQIETAFARVDTQETQQVFAANGTYTKPAGLKGAWVEVQAGGGGSGAAGATAAAQASIGGPGGGGEYRAAYIPASAMGATVAVTVGAGGTAGAGAGGSGGASSFGAFLTTVGGGGGALGAAASVVVTGGGAAGTGGGGTASNILAIPGQQGNGCRTAGGEPVSPQGGGRSVMGAGGAILNSTNTCGGQIGTGFGSGGSSALNRPSQSIANGGAGAPGVVTVRNVF